MTYNTPAPFFPTILNPTGGSMSIEFVLKDPNVATSAGPGAFVANDGMTFKAN